MASTLSHGDTADDCLDAINGILDRNLLVVNPAELNFDAEDERELHFQRKLLEHCLVQGGVPDREGNPKVGVRKRRQEAEDILKFFGAPWNEKYGIVHPCPAGCCGELPCANKAKSVERAQTLASIIFMPPISVPAANKYTKVDPCIKSCALVTWTFGLLRKAVGIKLGKKDTGSAATENIDADSAIEIPCDEI